MPHDVFISHASFDKRIADTVVHRLESKGVRCWISPRDVAAGRSYSAEIVNAIEQSAALILVLTAHANDSTPVAGEVELAIRSGVPVIPFRTEDIEPSPDILLHIGRVHWLDALTPPLEAHVDRLADTVRTFLNPESTPPERPKIRPKRRARTAAIVSCVAALGAAGAAGTWRIWSSGDHRDEARVPGQAVRSESTTQPDGPSPSAAHDPTGEPDTETGRDAPTRLVRNDPAATVPDAPTPPLAHLSVTRTPTGIAVTGPVLNERDMQRVGDELGPGVTNRVQALPGSVRALVARALQEAGIARAVVVVRTRPNWGDAYLDIRAPGDALPEVERIASGFVLFDDDLRITPEP